MLRFVGDIIERIGIVVCALITVQIPLFIKQYEQQLVGRIAELKMQVDAMKQLAQGRTLDAYIEKFISSSDSDFSMHGELLKNVVNRYFSLSDAYAQLAQASLFQKPYVFATHFHQDVVMSTWSHFSPGLLLTLEGAVFALAGVFLGMLVALVVRKSAKWRFRTQKSRV